MNQLKILQDKYKQLINKNNKMPIGYKLTKEELFVDECPREEVLKQKEASRKIIQEATLFESEKNRVRLQKLQKAFDINWSPFHVANIEGNSERVKKAERCLNGSGCI